MSTLFSELISTLKMTGVAPITLQPFDGTHLKYPLFKKQFFAIYHNRIAEVVLWMSHLQNMLTDIFKEVVSESIEDPKNYDLVRKRLGHEYGYTTVKLQSKIIKMLDIPELKSKDPKQVRTFARKLHNSISELSKGEEASELLSQGNIRFMSLKLPTSLREKWSGKCYDARP